MLVKLGEVHTKVVSKVRSWTKGDQSNSCKLTLGEDDEVKTSPKAKVYVMFSFLLVETQ